MDKWEEMRFDILRDYYISAKRRLEWAVKHDRPWGEYTCFYTGASNGINAGRFLQ